MFRAMSDVVGSHLMDRKLFDFNELRAGEAESGGVGPPEIAPIRIHGRSRGEFDEG
jgi:hypothetical protein